MREEEIATEAVRIWKENPSMDYLEAIKKAKSLYEGVDADD